MELFSGIEKGGTYGELYVLQDLAKIVKISRATLRKHLNNGMNIYEIAKQVNKVKRI